MQAVDRKSYPQDVSDEEWSFVLPYLLLSREDSRSRKHSLRELFNGVRYIVRTGNQWRYMPNDLPPWPAVYQQMRRWMEAGVFEILVADVQELLRHFGGRKGQPTAVCIDSRTLQSTPESGARAGYDGAKRRKGSKVHIAVDTLGHLMALKVTAASEGDREQVARVGRTGATGHRLNGGACVCGPGLHRRERRPGRTRARHTPQRGQTSDGQTRLRPAAQTVGRRT